MEEKELVIKTLIAADYNPRRLTDRQFQELRRSMKEFGPVQRAVVNTFEGRENIIIGGHQRVRVWASLGHATYPCILVSLNPEREKELNIRLNHAQGEWDKDKLANFFDTADLMDFGFDPGEIGMGLTPPGEEGEGEQPPKKIKTCPHCGEILP